MGAAGLVTSLETGPAGAHQDQIAIAVTNTAPATTAATASASTRLISFSMGLVSGGQDSIAAPGWQPHVAPRPAKCEMQGDFHPERPGQQTL